MRESVRHSVSTRVGQWFFSIMSHPLYDTGLYRFVTHRFWRCPTGRLMDNYADNISDNHLEIGVGSGYFLEHTLCADFLRRLVLLDLNRRCLAKSATRLRSYAPRVCHHDILNPLTSAEPGFSSVGMNYVLHCIPGGFRKNQRIFRHVGSVLEEAGVFFGATLIAQPLHNGVASWLLMKLMNTVGIFGNALHSVAELKSTLESFFSEVEVSVVGSAAVFRAVK